MMHNDELTANAEHDSVCLDYCINYLYGSETIDLPPAAEVKVSSDYDINESFEEMYHAFTLRCPTHLNPDDIDWMHTMMHGNNADPPDDSPRPAVTEPRATTRRKRRLNELERLRKNSWERQVLPDFGKQFKRQRYKYINTTSGASATSMREALRCCRSSE